MKASLKARNIKYIVLISVSNKFVIYKLKLKTFLIPNALKAKPNRKMILLFLGFSPNCLRFLVL